MKTTQPGDRLGDTLGGDEIAIHFGCLLNPIFAGVLQVL
jgi:hypothetical protein